MALTAPRSPASAGRTNKLVLPDETTETEVPKSLAPVSVMFPVPPVRVVAPVTVNGPPLIPTAVAVKLFAPEVAPNDRPPFVTVELKFPLIDKSARFKGLELLMVTSPTGKPAAPIKVTLPVKAFAALTAVNDPPTGRRKVLVPPTDI